MSKRYNKCTLDAERVTPAGPYNLVLVVALLKTFCVFGVVVQTAASKETKSSSL